MMNVEVKDLLDLNRTIAKELFEGVQYPWEVLDDISNFILKLGPSLPEDEFYSPKENVWIAKDAEVFESAYIGAPCIIDHNAEVRHCAFIRGSAIVGKNCVVGNSVELKNVVLFDNYKSHMGAGSITSNVKSDKSLVVVKGNEQIPTKRKKFGAVLGDFVEVGCNSVLNPGTVIGAHTNIYPTSSVRGVIPENSIYKNERTVVPKRIANKMI